MGSKDSSRSPLPGAIPAVILAAGKGTRMKASEPKAVAEVGGRPMIARVAEAMRSAGAVRIIAVVGHGAEEVRAAIGDSVEYVRQERQLGTGDAARCAQKALGDYEGPVVVAYADIPLLSKSDVRRLVERHLGKRPAATLLTAIFDEPGSLGRIIRAEDGRVEAIVEARDASEEQLRIREINVGVYCFEAPLLFEVLAEVTTDNAQAQYYLTDAIGILVARGERVEAIAVQSAYRGMGVDTEEDLARARDLWRMRGGH